MSLLFLFVPLLLATAPARAGDWQLVWSDEFDYTGLPDPQKWTFEEGFIRNQELQYYTAQLLTNARVEEGRLIVEAQREDHPNAGYEPGSDNWRRNRPHAEYTSASLTTQGRAEWRYGRIEVRARLPQGRGVWPAIWMLGTNRPDVGWPQCGEIDIMEYVGFDPHTIHANVHTGRYNHVRGTAKGDKIHIEKPYERFHVYAIEWHPDRIDFFVDDLKYFSYVKEPDAGEDVWPFDQPFYLILNLAIGGSWGGREGIDPAIFPQRFEIDFVRVYQKRSLREVNEVARPDPSQVVAIVGATLIDGRGGSPVPDAVVVVRGERIAAAGSRASVEIPTDADVFDARGMTLLPGLIDAHFHLGGDLGLPSLFLAHGVTALRDPGAWNERYDPVRQGSDPVPRLFLTGPHLDSPPPAYPGSAYLVRDAEEARRAVDRFVDEGASAIKVYFRLPLGLIRAIGDAAHARGVVVTAHLEIVEAGDAIRAGVDGIEHVTSFGTALLSLPEAERYRQAVIADNEARRQGRYEMWSRIDLDTARARELFDLIALKGTVVSPTLAVFERRQGDPNVTDVHVRAFENMLAFAGRAKRAGARVVVGSHSSVPHADKGWAYHREMELLLESGLTPMETILAATLENARFFRSDDRLGSIEAGKLADFVLVEGDPLHDFEAMRRVRRVMLNGVWVAHHSGMP